MHRPNRRDLMKLTGAATLAATFAGPLFAQASGRVVIVGAGFGGASCARTLRRIAPGLNVTLIDRNPAFVTCPFSNKVLGGLAEIGDVTHDFDGLRAAGVEVVIANVDAIEPDTNSLRLADGSDLSYDRLVLSPGIAFKWGALTGYDREAAEIMPHAWQAGPQTELLRRQLVAMEDGGTVIIAPPLNPFRCPPGPYERASLIAHYLKTEKPRSKILILDAKDDFSKQGLFIEGWETLYPGLIEWVPFGMGGGVMAVDPATMTLDTGFETFTGDVVNVIPPQRAADLVFDAGLTGEGEWCSVDGHTFESRVAPGIHILGDAIIAGDMPKSGFSASSQGRACAHVIAALLDGGDAPTLSFVNTCYSLLAPDYGISVAGVYSVDATGAIIGVPDSGGVSPRGADAAFRAREAAYAESWYANLTSDIFA